MFVMMGLQKYFYLLCEKGEKLMSRLGFHQSMRHGYFGLRERERLIAMKDNATNAKIGATEVDGKIDTLEHVNNTLNTKLKPDLLRPIRDCSNI